MRKIGAHFYLRPDGTLGKHPVIELGDDGTILKVRELGEHFKEEPSLEFFSGLLVPGLVEDWSTLNMSQADFEVNLRRAKASGSIRILPPSSFGNEKSSYQPVWQKLLNHPETENILQELKQYTFDASKGIGKENDWGVLKEGATPGIVLIQGVNWDTLTVKDNARIRIIVQ
jgi:hypothetical protein